MTETEWLAATDPRPMLAFVTCSDAKGGLITLMFAIRPMAEPPPGGRRVNDGRLRLLVVECCCRAERLLAEAGVGPADRLADARELLESAERVARGGEPVRQSPEPRFPPPPLSAADHLLAAARVAAAPDLRYTDSWGRETLRVVDALDGARSAVACAAAGPAPPNGSEPWHADWMAAYRAELVAQVGLVRCACGNPFRPSPPVAPDVRAWSDGTVVKLARAISDGRAFERLPVLADALEDAGCVEAEVLGHLRGPGPHARGCWALDLLVGQW